MHHSCFTRRRQGARSLTRKTLLVAPSPHAPHTHEHSSERSPPRNPEPLLQYEPESADLYVFGSPKNTEGYQFSKTFFGVIFANNPNLEESLPIKHAAPLQDAGVQLVDSWSSRPGEQLAGLTKCFESAGQKEVSCAGLRGPARAARVALGGVAAVRVAAATPPRKPAGGCTGAGEWPLTRVV